MSFKIDFSKIGKETAEEAALRRKKEEQEWEETIRTTIEANRKKVEEVCAHEQKFLPGDADFMRSMRRYSEEWDIVTGKVGGKLTRLTRPQANNLDRLHKKHCQPTSKPKP
jgi:hypothetical protein